MGLRTLHSGFKYQHFGSKQNFNNSYQAYRMFDEVVKLDVNQRVPCMTAEQVQLRNLLLGPHEG